MIGAMKDVVPTYVRIPGDLKSQLETAAHENDRSLNMEIVRRLKESFGTSAERLHMIDSADLMAELIRRYQPGHLLIKVGKD